MRFQYRGVFPAQKRANSDWSLDRPDPLKDPIILTSLRSAASSALSRAKGGGKRNCSGRARTHGSIVANCGAAPGAFAKGVGRQAPTAAGMPTMLATPKNGGGAGAIPSLSRHCQIKKATFCPQSIPACTDWASSTALIALIDALRLSVSVEICAG